MAGALEMVAKALSLGLGVMVGCKGATSLAMASAFTLATQPAQVALDGPLRLQSDRDPPMAYLDLHLQAPD
ncbi:MAG: hypothetical protein CFE45_42460 [Burkholderiales bacterium PBB5]|nr:MAG: hypothetical protein CFE45_42460 [Burkholderiales bacterium PBB5]